jgi:hypothetical protein
MSSYTPTYDITQGAPSGSDQSGMSSGATGGSFEQSESPVKPLIYVNSNFDQHKTSVFEKDGVVGGWKGHRIIVQCTVPGQYRERLNIFYEAIPTKAGYSINGLIKMETEGVNQPTVILSTISQACNQQPNFQDAKAPWTRFIIASKVMGNLWEAPCRAAAPWLTDDFVQQVNTQLTQVQARASAQ